jgi:hypothetical protein
MDEVCKTFVRRTENVLPFAGMVASAWCGTYFWFNWLDNIPITRNTSDILSDFTYYQFFILLIALMISIVIPAAPYSTHKGKNGKNNSNVRNS